MKISVFLMFAFFFAIAGLPAAEEPRVFVVDNNGGPHAHFTDLQEAVDAAEDGDIFHVLGSPERYGHFTINRRVHLYGPGFRLDRLFGDGYQEIYEARTGGITFSVTETSSSAGSSISGLRIGNVTIEARDITIWRNLVDGSVHIGHSDERTDGAIVLQNYVRNEVRSRINIAPSSGHVIANNVTGGGSEGYLRNATFRNNVVKGISAIFENCIVENNLFGREIRDFSRNTIFRNNFFRVEQPASNDFPIENSFSGNQWGLGQEGWEALFTGEGVLGEVYRLSEASAARGAGYGGVDAGPFGGAHPYEIGGVPPLPRVKIMAPGPFLVSPHSDVSIPITIEAE